jgi:predicted small integral membrane protein
MDFQEVEFVSVDWIHLADNRDQWWALVKMVIYLQVP